jgi:hypothetical protein
MPIIRNSTTNSSKSALLTSRLVRELREPGTTGSPLVLENQISQTHRYHVTVIWDEWRDLPLQTRSRIILDAYEDVFPEKTGLISIAQGLTMCEAISMGLFPYKVIALLSRADEPMRDRALAALKAHGAVRGEHDLELRFRTLDEAERARIELQREVPGELWSVVQESDF